MLTFALVENLRDQQLAWIEKVLSANGWTPTEWARLAGVDPSTLSKFLTDDTNTKNLTSRTEHRLALVAGLARDGAPTPADVDAEATAWRANGGRDPFSLAIAAALEGQNGLVPWQLRTEALNAVGYLPDDVLLVDMNTHPRNGDVVCAQVKRADGTTENVFRVLQAPYLVAAHFGRELYKPLLVDGQDVKVQGVVLSSMRPRPHLQLAS